MTPKRTDKCTTNFFFKKKLKIKFKKNEKKLQMYI